MDIASYPQILTNDDWQRNKGKIAKIAGETGIGALMKKCEAEHKKGDFYNKFRASNNIDWRTVEPSKSRDEVVDELEPVLVKKYMAAAAPVRKLLVEIRDQAKKTAAQWKKNPLIPSSSTKHADEVAKAADQLFIGMKENSDAVKTLFAFDALRAELKKKREESLKVLGTQIAKCEDGLKVVLKNPTKKVWEAGGAHQGCRSVCNGMAAIAELKKLYYPTWQNFGDFYCKDIPDNDPEEALKVKAKVKTVANELIKYKSAVHKLLNG
jgi:hypothetical protein